MCGRWGDGGEKEIGGENRESGRAGRGVLEQSLPEAKIEEIETSG